MTRSKIDRKCQTMVSLGDSKSYLKIMLMNRFPNGQGRRGLRGPKTPDFSKIS